MGFKKGTANEDFRKDHSIIGCVEIDEERDWTPETVQEMLNWATGEGNACFTVGATKCILVAFQGRSQQGYRISQLIKELEFFKAKTLKAAASAT